MNVTEFGIDANFRATVRVFDEVVEMVVKPINHGLELARSESYGLRRPRAKKVEELHTVLTREELEERKRKDDENVIRAIRRAKQTVRFNVLRIKASHLLTITYRENMTDVERLKRDYDRFRRYVQAKYPDWDYVAVREKQDRGAWHLHIAVRGKQDIKFLRKCWYRVLGCTGASGENVLGQVDVQKSKKTGWKWRPRNIVGYMTKYMSKDFNLHEHSSKRYWTTRGNPKELVFKYWLTSSDMVEMIKDALMIGNNHGMTMLPDFWQSPDRTVLFYSGDKIPIPF